jgi:arylsulfatase A-like enzyme
MKKIKNAMKIFIPLLPASIMVAGCTLTGEKGKPNILFIYTDDQATRTVSCYPEAYPWVNTPNIDALASEGTLFRQAYNGAWCMPSRATMLTGHHQHNVQSMRMEGRYPGSTYDPGQCPFWPSVFRKAGYATAHIGKWHTGTDTGFGRDWDYQVVWNRPRYPENSVNYYYDQLIETNGGEPELLEEYSTDKYTEWAVEYIRDISQSDHKPWFLWLCYGAVHGPFTPADRHLDAYPDVPSPDIKDIYPPRPGKPEYAGSVEFWVPGEDGQPVEKEHNHAYNQPGRPLNDWIRQYHQGVLAIDEGVRRIVQALKETGQYDNTVIVFTSDQGFAWGQHGFRHKVAPYFANIAAPLIFRLPGSITAGRKGTVVDHPVSGVDLPVTFFSLAGLELPWRMDGWDLSPLLRDPDAPWEHPAMMVSTGTNYGSNTDTIPPKDDRRLYMGPGVPWYVILAQGRYKYIRTLVEGETDELYDMVSDPEELRNLAGDPAYRDILEQYRQAAIDELRRTGARFADQLPPLKAYGSDM